MAYRHKGREKEYRREWHEQNPGKQAVYSRKNYEKKKAYQREWAERNPEKAAEYREEQLARSRDAKLRTTYGISQADFDALLAAQGGKCAACRSPDPRGRNWQVDHCHDTGRVRGILCKSCNIGLGQLGDDAYRVSALLNYLS